MIVTYHPGGFLPAHPNKNRASVADLDAGTFTQWDQAGAVIVTRPLTAAEIAALTPAPPAPDPVADALQSAADSAAQAALEDVRALAPLLQAAANAVRGA